MKEKLTYERLHEALDYDPDTGDFYWIKTLSPAGMKGNKAGNLHNDGYNRIRIDTVLHKSSRLAFIYQKGYSPENDIDHINQIKHDDRWCNLREASRQCNVRNSGVFKNNKSGIKGVYYYPVTKMWQAYITVDGTKKHLGCFTKKKDAAAARLKSEQQNNFTDCLVLSSASKYLQGLI
ncbi:MAG: HNH endonuclease [Candidatus Omnitrophota bacterium]